MRFLIVVLCAAVLGTGCSRLPLRQRSAVAGPAASALLPRIPRDAARFVIDSVTDSTASFRVQEARWVRPGLSSYVVDPMQRDGLVARLRIIARDSATATALVTGQVSRVKTDHFLLVVRPERPWWKRREFWTGMLLGLALGGGGVALVR